MVFGSSENKSAEIFNDAIKELKNQVKLVELDLEKRMILLEGSITSIQKSVGALKDFESSKDAVSQINELKKTVREIDDTGLISKLETINNSDKITSISENIEILNSKLKLLSDAVEILGDSKSGSKEKEYSSEDISKIRSDISSLKNALSKISASIIAPEKIAEINTKVDSLEKTGSKANQELKEMYDLYHEKINMLERQISIASDSVKAQKDPLPEISEIKEEITQLKNINRRIVGMIEIDSKTLNNLKNIRDESQSYKNLLSTMDELSKKVSAIDREMSLERAMYPKNIMNLEKDINTLRASQKNMTEVVESLSKAKMRSSDSSSAKKLDIIEKSLIDITDKISEVSSLKSRITYFERDIKNLKEVQLNFNDKINSIQNKAPDKHDDLINSKRIKEIESSISQIIKIIETQKVQDNSSKPKLKKDSTDNVDLAGLKKDLDANKKHIIDVIDTFSEKFASMAEENRNLKQEIEELKHLCSEIIKESQDHPLIID